MVWPPPLPDSVGEVHLILLQVDKLLHLDALDVNDLDVNILAGMPFKKRSDVCTQYRSDQT